MNEQLIKLLIQVGLAGAQAWQELQAMKAANPEEFEAAMASIGGDHAAALARLEAAAAP